MKGWFLLCAVLACLLLGTAPSVAGEAIAPPEATPQPEPDTAQRDAIRAQAWQGFGGDVSKTMAQNTAWAQARTQALRAAMLLLAQHSDVRFVMEDASVWPGAWGQEAAVDFLLGTPQEEEQLQGIPPQLEVGVTLAYLPLPQDSELLRALHTIAGKRSALEERAALLEYLNRAVTDYTTAAALTNSEDRNTLTQAARRITAVRNYMELPPWDADINVMQPRAERLQALLRDAPDAVPLLCEYARVLVALGHHDAAQHNLELALTLKPDYPMTHALRGTLEMARHKPALAVRDITRALELSPRNPEHLYARAVAWRTLEDIPAMCADLKEACAFGWCGWYDDAKKADQCR